MKKIGSFLVPIVMILLVTQVVPRIASGAQGAKTVILSAALVFGIMLLLRPKKGVTKSVKELSDDILSGYAEGAFAEEDEISKKFFDAIDTWGKNMPKAAIGKLEKLQPLCRTNKERYAVSIATARCCFSQQRYKDAIREYNRALVICPDAELSVCVGDCHQRLGNLQKAQDAYEYAIELDPKNVRAMSILATTYVADWDYDTALDYAMEALALDDTYAQALATAAICYGMKNDSDQSAHYTQLASRYGYSEEKIKTTISTLKKKSKQ